MQYSDYQAAKNFIEEKALALMTHEKKGYAKVGFPIQNYNIYQIKGRTFYGVSTNIFKGVINEVLLEARKAFPLNFGQGNAISVIHAINKVEPLSGRIKDVVRILQNENCCYIVENVKGEISDRILRIDLFRKVEKRLDNKKKYDFTGGIFHALKHYSYQGKPLGTGNDINEVHHPSQIIEYIIKAFYFEHGEIDGNKYISRITLNEKRDLKFVFYHEKNSNVYFLSTIYITKKKKEKN